MCCRTLGRPIEKFSTEIRNLRIFFIFHPLSLFNGFSLGNAAALEMHTNDATTSKYEVKLARYITSLWLNFGALGKMCRQVDLY